MNPQSTADILELLHSPVASAAVGAAMELGLFWLLAEQSLPDSDVARALGIPWNRCHLWLQVLCKLGLLEVTAEGYAPSAVAREVILQALSRETWAFQAREERDSALLVQDLACHLGQPISTWQTRTPGASDYTRRLQDDPDYSARFTRKLYEIHLSLAEQIAKLLDLRGVRSMLDLGGGAGGVSFALLRRWPGLTSVVVDAQNVCLAGREIAEENGLEKRITYRAADLTRDSLPSGFDLVMLCDVGLFDESLVRKIHEALTSEGRLVIVDKFAPSNTDAPPSRLFPAFLDALQSPAGSVELTTAEEVQARLLQAGFGDLTAAAVPHADNLPWNLDWILLEARKQPRGI